MKTTITENNPFINSKTRYQFLYEILSQREKGIHLDYGAYDGYVIKNLAEAEIINQGVGVDLNSIIIRQHQHKMPENVSLVKIDNSCHLPYPNSYFDSISVLDVIEHIYDQKSLLRELSRVLKPSGIIIITVPKQHIFSWLDMGNFKFIFPGFHRFFYELKYSKTEYYKRYVECADGLFGDIEKLKMWHQHFTLAEMTELLNQCDLNVVKFDGSGLFMRLILLVKYVTLRPFSTLLDRLLKLDDLIFEDANLFCVAQKQ